MKSKNALSKIVLGSLSILLLLTGCGGQTTSSIGPNSMQSEVGGAITQEQAVAITKDVLKRCDDILFVLTYPSLLEADENQTIPEDPDFWLITDSRFQTMADLEAYTETGYTSDYMEKHLYYYFHEYPGDDIQGFKEYNNRLYANCRLGGKGNLLSYGIDTLRILSQSPDNLIIECDMYIEEAAPYEFQGTRTISMKKVDGVWLMQDNQEEYVQPSASNA